MGGESKVNLLKAIDFVGPLFTYLDIFQYVEDTSWMNHPPSYWGPSSLLVSVPLFVWFLFCIPCL